MWWFLLAMLLLTLVAIYWLLLFVKTLDPAESEAAAADGVPVDGHSALDRIVRHYRQTAAAAADRRPPFPSKELIMAMAQRKVYSWTTSAGNPQADGGGGDDDDDTGRWAREFINASCARLDAVQPDTLALECAVHEFCDRVNRVLDDEQARLCEINETLSTVTVARAALEDEVFKATGCVDPGASRPPDGDDCWTPRPEPHPSYPCPETDAAADDEEDALSAVYGQLVNDLERVTAAYVVSTAAQADRDVPDGSDGPEDGDDDDDDREDDPENDREDDGGPAESRGSSAVRSS